MPQQPQAKALGKDEREEIDISSQNQNGERKSRACGGREDGEAGKRLWGRGGGTTSGNSQGKGQDEVSKIPVMAIDGSFHLNKKEGGHESCEKRILLPVLARAHTNSTCPGQERGVNGLEKWQPATID